MWREEARSGGSRRRRASCIQVSSLGMSFIGAIVTMEGRVFGVSIMCTCVVRLFELLITNHGCFKKHLFAKQEQKGKKMGQIVREIGCLCICFLMEKAYTLSTFCQALCSHSSSSLKTHKNVHPSCVHVFLFMSMKTLSNFIRRVSKGVRFDSNREHLLA